MLQDILSCCLQFYRNNSFTTKKVLYLHNTILKKCNSVYFISKLTARSTKTIKTKTTRTASTTRATKVTRTTPAIRLTRATRTARAIKKQE